MGFVYRSLVAKQQDGRMAPRVAGRPRKIVVLGNSIALQVCARNPSPDEAPYPILLADLLADEDGPATVINASRWMGTVQDAVVEWPRAVLAEWPDLVVIHHGFNEARSAILPRRVHKAVWRLERTGTAIEARLLPKMRAAWPTMLSAARTFDRPVVRGHMTARRFGRLLAHLLDETSSRTPAVCVVVDLQTASPRLNALGAAYAHRRQDLQAVIAHTVAVRPRAAVASLTSVELAVGSPSEAFPDGIHLSAEGHRLLAQEIAHAFRELSRATRPAACGNRQDEAKSDMRGAGG
jgi:lysophospholipase L1-like esterase